jgi:hypothetical protein
MSVHIAVERPPAPAPWRVPPSLWPPIAPVRRLMPADRPALEAHYLALPPARRVERFGRAIDDEGIARHCEGIDWARVRVLGRFERGLRGVAELAADGGPHRASLALSLDDRAGWEAVGRDLLARSVALARTLGFAVLVAPMSGEEVRVRALMRALGARERVALGELALGPEPAPS